MENLEEKVVAHNTMVRLVNSVIGEYAAKLNKHVGKSVINKNGTWKAYTGLRRIQYFDTTDGRVSVEATEYGTLVVNIAFRRCGGVGGMLYYKLKHQPYFADINYLYKTVKAPFQPIQLEIENYEEQLAYVKLHEELKSKLETLKFKML